MPVSSREAAYLALAAYRKRGARPDRVLANQKDLEGREMALAANLMNGVLQNAALCDYYAGLYSTTPPDRLEIEVRDILRLSVYQLLFLTRVPVHAAVSQGTELAKRHIPRAAGYVNAVLRRVAENRDRLPPVRAENEARRLSIQYSHPLWLVEELLRTYGREACEGILVADNRASSVPIQVNTLKTTPQALLKRLEEAGAAAAPYPFLPGALTLSGAGAVDRLDAFRQGLFFVQDPAANLVTAAAAPKPGMRVLDLCAAPGGKSFACALKMEDRGEIRAFDIHEKKTAQILSGARRLGIACLSAAPGDAKTFHPALEGWADLVIADVPCSGFGVIRKKPEIRYKAPEELRRLPEIQLDILTNAARYVKPGGTLLYSTCTLLKRENEDVTGAFLEKNSGFSLEPFTLPEPFGGCSGQMTILPQTGDTDGFFICKMRSTGKKSGT